MGQFDIPDNDFNIQSFKVEPITLVHEFSTTEYYVGVSINGRDTARATWQIRKIIKIGGVWATALYPDGNQNFNFIWDLRFGYTFI